MMKRLFILILLLLTGSVFAQTVQRNTPWIQNSSLKTNANPTLEEVRAQAKNYFSTIDTDKKGSGLKPFERWAYHWSFFTKPDGTIAPAKDLWSAWEQKNKMNTAQAKADDSNWVSMGPYSHTNTGSWSPGQGRVNAVTIDPSNSDTYYVGAPAGGIWKSIDAGVQWTPLTDYLPQIGVSGIAVDPNNPQIIYIATGDDDAGDSYSVGVWKTTDGGTTWAATGSLNGNPNSMNDIYIHPNDSNTIMVATSSGVHKSTDAGTSWTIKLNANIRDLKMKPNDASVWYATTSNTFYKSSDAGETFQTKIISGLTSSSRLVMDVTKANSDYIYIVSAGSGSSFNGVYKSINSGETFLKTAENDDIFETSQAWYDLALAVSDTDADKVYVGVLNIWSSSNGGDNFTKLNNWSSPSEPSYTHADIHFMRFINGKFFAGTDGGVYISEDHGTNFTDLTESLAISQFYKISVARQNSGNIVGGLQDNGGYAFSDNNWNNYHGADGMDAAVSGSNPNTYYGFIQYGGQLYITNDGGLTRGSSVNAPSSETGTGDDGGRWVTPLVSDNDGNLYAGYNQLYKLIGGAWEQQSNLTSGEDIDHIEIDPNNPNNIYISKSGTLLRSTDGGTTFTTILTLSENINSIEINNGDSSTAYITTNSDVKKSENTLAASPLFTNITTNLPSESKLVLRHHQRSGKNTLYLGTALGVYFINDDSPNWEVFDNNLPNVAVRDLEIHEEDAKIFAATYGRGVFSSDIPNILPPKDISLVSINNPFNIACVTAFTPEILVSNKGTNQITEINITYTLNGTETTFNLPITIDSEQLATIDLPELSGVFGKNTLKVKTSTTDDAYAINNELEIDFIVNNSNSNPTVINSFEDALDDELFTETEGATSDLWAIGIPTGTLLNTAGTGNNVYATSLSGNYRNETTSYLYSKCIDLSKISTPILSFKMAFDIELNWDYLTFEYSINNGATWAILGNASDPNWYNSSSIENGIPGKQWTGEGENTHAAGDINATIREYSFDLAAFTSQSNILFRFKFFADYAVNEEGTLIDDWVVNGTVLSLNNEELLSNFAVYPNPSNGTFNLNWLEQGEASIIVYDYTGKLILKKHKITNNTFELNLNGFSKGLYIAKITINGKQAAKKLILE